MSNIDESQIRFWNKYYFILLSLEIFIQVKLNLKLSYQARMVLKCIRNYETQGLHGVPAHLIMNECSMYECFFRVAITELLDKEQIFELLQDVYGLL